MARDLGGTWGTTVNNHHRSQHQERPLRLITLERHRGSWALEAHNRRRQRTAKRWILRAVAAVAAVATNLAGYAAARGFAFELAPAWTCWALVAACAVSFAVMLAAFLGAERSR